jgi:hypothetical protein
VAERDTEKAARAAAETAGKALEAERDDLRRALTESRTALAGAEALHDRLARSRDEMIRAEGQIALIKDLLLNGSDL